MKRRSIVVFVIGLVILLMMIFSACDAFKTSVNGAPKFVDFGIEIDNQRADFDYTKKIPIQKDEYSVYPIDFIFNFENPNKYEFVSVKVNGTIIYAKDFKIESATKIVVAFVAKDIEDKKIKISDICFRVGSNNYLVPNFAFQTLEYEFNTQYTVVLDRSDADNVEKIKEYKIGSMVALDSILPDIGNDDSLDTDEDTFKRYSSFKGYYLSADGGEKVAANGYFAFNYNVTLYARFEENFEFVLHDGYAELSLYKSAALSMTNQMLGIPDFFDGLPVTKIGESAFANNNVSVVLKLSPKIVEIGDNAFKDSGVLVKFEKATALKKIGNYAFLNSTMIGSMNFPVSLEEIGEGAFIGHGWNSLKPSGNGTLRSSLVIGNHVKKIGKEAFKNTTFKKVFFMEGNPDLEIGEGAFRGCTKLEEVNFATKFAETSTSVEPPTLPAVKNISKDCFYGASVLTTLTFNEGVETIGESAFNRALILESVNAPNSLLKINARAFNANAKLKSFVTGSDSQLIELGDEAFSGCSDLTSLEIKGTKLGIYGSDVFYGCLKMESLFFNGVAPSFGEKKRLAIEGNNGFFIYVPVAYLDKYKESMKTATDFAKLKIIAAEYLLKVGGTNIASFDLLKDGSLKLMNVFDKTVTNLNIVSAYQHNPNLDFRIRDKKITVIGENFISKTIEEITLPSGIKILEQGAFKNCTKLKDVMAEDGDKTFRSFTELTTIGDYCFESTLISKFYAPKKLNDIGYRSFYFCLQLSDVKLINSDEGISLKIQREAFYGDPIVNLYLGKHVAVIEPNAFGHNTSADNTIRNMYLFRSQSATEFKGTLYFNSEIKIYIPDGTLDLYLNSSNDFKSINASGGILVNPKTESEDLYAE